LKPITETLGDRNSYGFREGRSCADAIGQCFCALAKSYAPVWVLEGDIQSCFDQISHQWLLQSIPMDRRILRQWLKAGYWEKGRLFPTEAGTPQGGIVSPALANLTLDGLEQAIRSRIKIRRDQVNFIRYADDFVVTARKRETLEEVVRPVIVEFLKERGLALSEQKTVITHIREGFNFLGQNVRKHGNKLIIKPAKEGVKAIVKKIRQTIKEAVGQTAAMLIRRLNPILRGWANYHRYVCSAKTFWTMSRIVQYQLLKWARRTHPNKSYGWLKRKYFSRGEEFGFFATERKRNGQSKVLRLHQIARTVLERHIKVRGEANPYDPAYTRYFERRRGFAWRTLPLKRTGRMVPTGV
jgi:RNA-directed DNA polymerase